MEYLTKPWDHQKKVVEIADVTRPAKLGDIALFFDMGTGKSKTTVDILRKHFLHHKRVRRTLILGPAIVVRNWQNEFKIHSKIRETDVVALTGPGKRRVQDFSDAATDPRALTLTRGRIFVTNYEAMEMEDLVHLIRQWKPEILICDESHRLKSHDSVRSKIVATIADLAEHRYILTGSPILNTAMDIFQQFRILDGGRTFGTNFWEFRGRYFEDLNKGMPSDRHFPKWIPRQETYEELNKKIYRKAFRVLKKDCLDLPPLIRQRVAVEMSKDQRKHYEEMKREYITFIKEHEAAGEPKAVVAQLAVTKALRLQQIVSGFVKTEDGVEIELKENPRLDALKDLLTDLTPAHKVIVWATFHNNYRQLAEACRKLKVPYVEIHGGISHTERNKAMARFREQEDCRVVIANQGAAGIGINLVEASYSIFYSRDFSLEHDLQAESRNYRGGSEMHDKITRIDLISPGTIDELVLEALAGKQNIAEQVLSWEGRL